MSDTIFIQRICKLKSIPSNKQLRQWVKTSLEDKYDNANITLRIIEEEESTKLNFAFRNKSKPTNVLSFPYELEPLWGDIALCAPLIKAEAKQQGKKLNAHWAHLVVHACLHLLGFDHETEEDSFVMENREIEILKILGFDDPYKEIHND